MFIYFSFTLQIAGRGDSHVNFEGFRKIYDSIMTVKEVSDDDLSLILMYCACQILLCTQNIFLFWFSLQLVVQFSDYIENG